jgi:hypothetical protein
VICTSKSTRYTQSLVVKDHFQLESSVSLMKYDPHPTPSHMHPDCETLRPVHALRNAHPSTNMYAHF